MMIYVKMLNVHRWHRTWSSLVVEPDTVGELREIEDGLFSVLWPGQVRPVLCLPNTVEVVEGGFCPKRGMRFTERGKSPDVSRSRGVKLLGIFRSSLMLPTR